MDAELAKYHKNNTSLDLFVRELQTKLKAAEDELKAKKTECATLKNMLQRVRSDIQTAVGHIQDPKQLVSAIRNMHKTHCVDVCPFF